MKTIRHYGLMFLHQPLLIFLCLSMPLLALFATTFGHNQDTHIQVGFLLDSTSDSSSDSDGHALMNRFRENLFMYPGDITFHEYTDPTLLLQDCASEKLECAYIIPINLPDALDQGHISNQIDLYTNRTTSTEQVVNQALYSCFFREYALRLLEHYLDQYSPDTLSGYSSEQLAKLFHTHASSGETFSFDYHNRTRNTVIHSESLVKHAMTGILPLLALLASLCTYFYYDRLNRAGAFSKMHARNRFPYFAGYSAVSGLPVLLDLSVSFCILQGVHGILLCKCLLLYCILFLFQLFCYGIRATKKGLLSVTPLYLLSCMIFSPMIFDLRTNPLIRMVSHLVLSNLFY